MIRTLRRVAALLLCLCLAAPLPALGEGMDDLLLKAEAYVSAGEHEKAFVCYTLAARVSPEDPLPLLSAGLLHLSVGEAAEAKTLADEALARSPALAEAWLLRLHADIDLADGEAVAQDLLYAEVCGAVLSPAVYASLGALYSDAGDFERAIDAFDLAVPSELTEAQRAAYARALLRTGDTQKADALGLLAASRRDAALDAVFQSGAPALQEVSLWGNDAEQYEVVFSAAQLDFMSFDASVYAPRRSEDGRVIAVAMPAQEVRALLNAARPLSVSPDGETVLLYAEGMLAALRGNILTLLLEAQDRGVADTYGNLERYMDDIVGAGLVGEEGVVWSPDGRYAVITNARDVLMTMRFIVDPILIDTQTGEIFLTATYPDKLLDGGAAVTQARFDGTGRYLYYLLYGYYGNNKCALMRYDLLNDETILCYDGPQLAYYPSLCELSDGCLLALLDVFGSDLACGLNVYAQEAGGWRNDPQVFSLPARCFYPRSLAYAANSDYALITGLLYRSLPALLMRLQPGSGFAGREDYWAIESLRGRAATRLTAAQVEAEFASIQTDLGTGSDADALSDLLGSKYVSIHRACLSPDGHYALLYCSGKDDTGADAYAFLLLRLEDMALVPVQADPQLLMGAAASPSAGPLYAPGVSWCADGTLLILGEEGVKAYRLQ